MERLRMSKSIKDIAETFIYPARCREVFLPLDRPQSKPLLDRGIQAAGISHLSYPYEVGRPDPNFHSLNGTLEGKGYFESVSESRFLEKGALWLVPSHTRCRYTVPKGKHWKIIWFHLKDIDRWQDIRGMEPCKLIGNILPRLYSAMEGFIAECLSENRNANITSEYYAHIIGAYIDRILNFELNAPQKYILEKLERLILDINQHLDYPWTVEEMSKRVHISEVQFYRWMVNLYGETPMGMVTRLRMKNALDMLTNTDYTIEQISYSVGYTNRFAFSKAFKRFYGLSPLPYRKEL
jgi:AraC-like DNA-binding protein